MILIRYMCNWAQLINSERRSCLAGSFQGLPSLITGTTIRGDKGQRTSLGGGQCLNKK